MTRISFSAIRTINFCHVEQYQQQQQQQQKQQHNNKTSWAWLKKKRKEKKTKQTDNKYIFVGNSIRFDSIPYLPIQYLWLSSTVISTNVGRW